MIQNIVTFGDNKLTIHYWMKHALEGYNKKTILIHV